MNAPPLFVGVAGPRGMFPGGGKLLQAARLTAAGHSIWETVALSRCAKNTVVKLRRAMWEVYPQMPKLCGCGRSIHHAGLCRARRERAARMAAA